MSAPQPPEAAVEAALAVSPVIWWKTSMHTPQGRLEQPVTDMKADEAASRQLVERQLAAVLPHLHRAILEDLIAKYTARRRELWQHLQPDEIKIQSGRYWEWKEAETMARLLRAELAEGGGGE